MKKNILVLKIIFSLCVCFISSIYAQESLRSTATSRLFKNPSDWTIIPSKEFNSLENDYIILLGNSTISGKIDTGATLGYYRHGTIPFSMSLNINLVSNKHTEISESTIPNSNTIIKTEYENPVFNTYKGMFRGIVGISKFFDSSIGLVLKVDGSSKNNYKQIVTTTVNGVQTSRIEKNTRNDKQIYIVSVPLFMDFGRIQNYASPTFSFVSTQIAENNSNEIKNATNQFAFNFYDKISFKSLIPNGEKTNVWGFIGSGAISIEETEVPAFGSYNDKSTMGQIGISNRYDIKLGANSSLSINPKIYGDWIFVADENTTFGITIASDVGLYAKLGDLPLAVFTGIMPRLYFWQSRYTTKYEAALGTKNISVERKLSTDILWTGKIGLSIFLPKNANLDITCDVDTTTKLVGISAQITLPIR